MMKYALTFILVILSLAFNTSQAGSHEKQDKISDHWLLDEKDQTKRLQKLEKYLRGFDQPMLEVGQRFKRLHQALVDDNHQLAVYQWKKIKKTIENGYMKRPKREKNSKLIFLNDHWKEILKDFENPDITVSWQGFQKAQAACMACHAAEGVAFMNNQPVFKLNIYDKSKKR